MDDFNGVDDLPPLDLNGVARVEYAGYRVQVSVAYVNMSLVTSLGLDATTDAKLVTITVTPPGHSSLAFPFLRQHDCLPVWVKDLRGLIENWKQQSPRVTWHRLKRQRSARTLDTHH